MSSVRPQTEIIRRYILQNVEDRGSDIAVRVTRRFEISRQAAHRHLKSLVAEGVIEAKGNTRSLVYSLAKILNRRWRYKLPGSPEEHIVWERDVSPLLGGLPKNVLQLLQFGFTEMFNNAIDHSGGTKISVILGQTALKTSIVVHDNGVGIFKKIKEALGLEDERHSVLQLAKGKLTTDPARHSGEGIFFTSRMFHPFIIVSDKTFFNHDVGSERIGIHELDHEGTTVSMTIGNRSKLKMVDVFSQFSSGEEKDFSKTVVPVRMAQFGTDHLISRSQARRVVAGLDKFSTVIFDFEDVELIGQGFADEIFRVFQNSHPEIELRSIHSVPDVQMFIDRVVRPKRRPKTSAA